ncbi:hypothetical protein [Nonomuraea sp. NPDC050691]|uniref:hypothetical protein n=1 Tax=Nonomuraea sp. NPDC050691 TaxID=3155661 RepID=UPI0033D7F21D
MRLRRPVPPRCSPGAQIKVRPGELALLPERALPFLAADPAVPRRVFGPSS